MSLLKYEKLERKIKLIQKEIKNLQQLWQMRKAWRLHAKDHVKDGIDDLESLLKLENLSGIITEVQHGTKTTIPDSHHSSNQLLTEHSDVEIAVILNGQVLVWDATAQKWKNDLYQHFHHTPVGQTLNNGEVSTSSTDWVDLITIPSIEQIKWRNYRMDFNCNVRNIGTETGQGVIFGYFVGAYFLRQFTFEDNSQMYKPFHFIHQYMCYSAVGTLDLKIKWKVMNASYASYTKLRLFSYMGLFTQGL